MPRPNPSPPLAPRDSAHFDPEINPGFSTIPVEAEQPSASEKFGHALWEIFKTISIILLAALFIRSLVVQPFFVDGQSMEPSFRESDYLLVNQMSYRWGTPKRGDVIVFKAPPEPSENYIKRIIGAPNDTVELKNGRFRVTLPGKQPIEIKEDYIAPGITTLPESDQTVWRLQENEYFVAGDNREPNKSSDSRQWGPVTRDAIIGKVALRVYPLADFGGIPHQEYTELSTGSFANRLSFGLIHSE